MAADPLDRLLYAIPESAYRIMGTLFFLACVAHKISVYDSYANKFLWFLESLLFFSLAVFYIFRKPPVKRATGPGETLLPLLGGGWPFLLIMTPRSEFGLVHQRELLVLMCVGSAFTLWAYFSLNNAFTIMVEARELKTNGPYRWIRHPVYSGQIFTAAVVCAWRFSVLNAVLFILFACIQYYRALLEEKKLSSTFPGYRVFKESRGMFIPRF